MEHGTSNFSPAIPASQEFDRRVYAREFRGLLGWGTTWFNKKIAAGEIPLGRRDCDGGRPFWLASQVREVLTRLNTAARTDAAVTRTPKLAATTTERPAA